MKINRWSLRHSTRSKADPCRPITEHQDGLNVHSEWTHQEPREMGGPRLDVLQARTDLQRYRGMDKIPQQCNENNLDKRPQRHKGQLLKIYAFALRSELAESSLSGRSRFSAPSVCSYHLRGAYHLAFTFLPSIPNSCIYRLY